MTTAQNSPRVDEALRDRYQQLVAGGSADGPRGSIVVAVYTTDLDEGRGDIFVAAGLARSLVRRGWGVRFQPRHRWDDGPGDADVVLAMLPGYDPGLVRRGAAVVAWVRNETDVWLRHPRLALFDGVLASSRVSLAALRERYSGLTGLLPIGVDPELFHGDPHARRTDVVSSVNHWGRARGLHRAASLLPGSLRIRWYGDPGRLTGPLARHAEGRVSYFALADAYRTAAIVLDDLNHTTLPYGNVNSRVFEAAACGALPATNGALGLADLGLEDVPVYRSAADLEALIRLVNEDPEGVRRRATAVQEKVLADHTFEARVADLEPVLAEAVAASRRRTRTIVSFPDYRSANPYQEMLASRLPDDVTVVPAERFDQPLPRDDGGSLDDVLFHLHWTSPIIQPARTPFEAVQRFDHFVARVKDLLARGGKLLWTVHNVLPHETRYRPIEGELARFLAAHASAIHVMGTGTYDAVRPHYELDPARTVVIRHPSYADVYPDFVDRTAARARLGVGRHDVALLVLGGIRPYKGLDQLLDTLDDLLLTEPRLRLLVAGRPGRFPELEELRERCEAHPRVTARFEHVPDAELQLWCRAADLAVLPYRSILNSGALMLALTFGLPVVAPAYGNLSELLDPRFARSFDPEQPDELRAAILSAVAELRTSAAARAAQDASDAFHPVHVAARFAELVEALLPRHPAGAATVGSDGGERRSANTGGGGSGGPRASPARDGGTTDQR